jgi:hypothetical protein
VYRTKDGIVLRDPDGAVYAEGTAVFDPAWVSTATSLGNVLVLHGPRLGIRIPPGRTAASYTIDVRAKEIKQGRREGLLAGATVEWQPVPLDGMVAHITDTDVDLHRLGVPRGGP